MKKLFAIILFTIYSQFSFSQKAPEITPNSFTLPRLTTAERDATKPVRGQIIFNTTTNEIEYFNGSWRYFSTYQTVNISSVQSISLLEGQLGKVDFTVSKDYNLTGTYNVWGSNISLENTSGTFTSGILPINFVATVVGNGVITLSINDSQNRSQYKNVKVIVKSPGAVTKNYVDSTLTAAYKSLLGWTDYWTPIDISPSRWMLDVASDDYHKGSDPGDYTILSQIENFSWDANNSILSNNWISGYEGVRRANNAIVAAKAYNNIDPNYAKQIEAEATFLRAYYHFDLYKLFKNIPYRLNTDLLNKKQNLQGSEVLLNIIKDLENSIVNLPTVKSGLGRIDKMVAYSFLGKAKLYIRDYNGALTAFNTVINSGRYALNYDFHDNFKENSDQTSEAILQANLNFGSPTYTGFLYADRLALPYNNAPSNCCGFKTATYDLAFAFKTDNNGLPIPSNVGTLSRVLANTTTLLDPRIDWTIGRSNVPFLDWGLHSDLWIRNASFAGYYSDKKGVLAYLGGLRKGDYGELLSNANYNLMRYADLLLMAAECEVQVGSLEKARTYVNQIRERASHTAQGASSISVASNASEITWATYRVRQYTTTWTDKLLALETVKLERRLELAMEGHRLFDLQRWGDLEKVIIPYINREKTLATAANSIVAPTSKNYAFPIPQTEIDKSGGLIIQNPGY